MAKRSNPKTAKVKAVPAAIVRPTVKKRIQRKQKREGIKGKQATVENQKIEPTKTPQSGGYLPTGRQASAPVPEKTAATPSIAVLAQKKSRFGFGKKAEVKPVAEPTPIEAAQVEAQQAMAPAGRPIKKKIAAFMRSLRPSTTSGWASSVPYSFKVLVPC